MKNIHEYVNMFITLLAIVDPIGGIPVLLSLVGEGALKGKQRAAWLAAATVFVVLALSALAGEKLLEAFGIQIASFRVAGGILLLLIGIKMMLADHRFQLDRAELAETNPKDDGYIFVPLAIPLLSGPGAISSMILFAHRHSGMHHYMLLLGISLLIGLLTGLILSLARPVSKFLGANGLKISTRLMGLLLSAAAVQFMANGLTELFPGWLG